MKSIRIKREENKALENPSVKPKSMERAIRALKSRFATNDIKHMKDIPNEYSTGIRSALGLGYETMITRFYDPRKLTLEDIMNTADIIGTEYETVFKVAFNEAKHNHVKRDISKLISIDGEIAE